MTTASYDDVAPQQGSFPAGDDHRSGQPATSQADHGPRPPAAAVANGTTTWEPRPRRTIPLRDAEAALVADEPTVIRFFGKVAMPSAFDACWPWVGSRDVPKGYGRFSSRGKPVMAHRAAYILAVGSIAPGLQIDHLCKNTSCVNPLHLEAVPGNINNLRGESPSARNAIKTECLRGHEFNEANTGRQGRRGRFCRACRRLGKAA